MLTSSGRLLGLPQTVAFRLYSNPDAFPSKETQGAICKAFNAPPVLCDVSLVMGKNKDTKEVATFYLM